MKKNFFLKKVLILQHLTKIITFRYKKVAKKWYGEACDGGDQGGCDNYKKLNQQGY